MEAEQFFICPYCWQKISVVLDLSVKEQTYIEDCEVCCQPIEIRYRAPGSDIELFEVSKQ